MKQKKFLKFNFIPFSEIPHSPKQTKTIQCGTVDHCPLECDTDHTKRVTKFASVKIM